MEGTTATPLTGITRTAVGPIDCISQGWSLVRDRYGQAVALVAIFYGAMLIPYGSIVLLGPAMCGVFYVYFKWMRGEDATVGSIFKGFEWMWDAFLATILMMVIIYALTLPPSAVVVIVAFRVFQDALMSHGDPDPVVMISLIAVSGRQPPFFPSRDGRATRARTRLEVPAWRSSRRRGRGRSGSGSSRSTRARATRSRTSPRRRG